MKKMFLSALVATLLCSCAGENLRTGDLLFLSGTSDFTDAIEAVTDGAYSHVGIVETGPDGVFVLEATPDGGVVRTDLSAFLQDGAILPDGTPAVRAYRVKGWKEKEGAKAAERARQYLGRPYDFAFLPGMEAVYCSELVYECFLTGAGEHLFSARPMTFRDGSGETAPYWTEYYEKMGVDIPEGVPGTNPNDLSRDPRLVPLHWKP